MRDDYPPFGRAWPEEPEHEDSPAPADRAPGEPLPSEDVPPPSVTTDETTVPPQTPNAPEPPSEDVSIVVEDDAPQPVGQQPDLPDLPELPTWPDSPEPGAPSAAHAADGPDEEPEPGIVLPETLPILPLKGTVVYPYAVMPLGIGQDRSIRLIDEVMRSDRLVGLVAQRDEDVEVAGPDDTFRVGTVARIARLLRAPDGTMQVLVQGMARIVIDEYVAEEPFLRARVHLSPEASEAGIEIEARTRTAIDLFQRMINLVQYLPDHLAVTVMNLNDPHLVVYLIASSAQMDLELRQQLLELDSIREKLDKVNSYLVRELEILELGKKLHTQAQEEMGKAQREYFLREQLKAIQKELGEESEEAATINELRAKLEQAQLPEEALKEAQRELSRLEKLPAASPEYSVIRTYVELLLSLPWSVSTGKSIDVPHARQVLDEDHYDLQKIKDRILEYLAVRHLKEQRQGTESGGPTTGAPTSREPILCFVGPPGVGKTSLGQSIARALGREFVRMSLGGIHDEGEIRGHRRTYIGAMPGRIIQSLRRVGSNDPVFMLDEVDKLASDWRGDPSSALLEVLDPEQNHAFRDNYLDLAFDLSHVMFIATANSLDPIPAPLRDRMEILELTGYTEEEKLHIARRYLLPKQLAANGLRPDELELSDETLVRVIRGYTREAGVRGLEREIGALCRKLVLRIAEGQEGGLRVSPDMVRDLLGRPRFFDDAAERIDRPGVATGLVWTPVGGDIIFIEAAMMPSREHQLTLTGQLGDVMKESAVAALSYVRSNAEALGINPSVFENKAIHIHVPEGAIPKDGPSAGVTMMTALVSLASGKRVRSDVAMTGEISLRGKVLPIGGLKEKVLAAHRAGIKTVIFPRRNESDLEDVTELNGEVTLVPVDDARQVLARALESGPQARVNPSSLRDAESTGLSASQS